MRIYYHHITASVLPITDSDLNSLFELFQVPKILFQDYTAKTSGTRVLTYTDPQTGKESIAISIPKTSYAGIKVHGVFFDNFSDFPVHKFWEFIKGKDGNAKRLDISFEDTEHLLDFDQIVHMSRTANYMSFITGNSIVARKCKKKSETPSITDRRGVPDIRENQKVIHFGDKGAPVSARIYEMASGNFKAEIEVTDKDHTAAILDNYSPETVDKWKSIVTSALVGCVNFVTPSSKRAKRPVKIGFWKDFLGSDVAAIKWTDYEPIQDAAALSFEESLQRVFGSLHNLAARFLITEDLKAAIDDLRGNFVAAFNSESDSLIL